MHQGLDGSRRVADARAAFLTRGAAGEPGVRDVVAASWRRSRSAGVDADEYRITYHEDVDLDSRLVRCARPVIERLAAEMVEVPVTIALSDAQARIVHRLDCSTSVGRALDRVDFVAGFDFAEGGVGTNGIGTVFETGSSVSVVGAEHFTEALVRFACTGAPVRDPATGRVEGVLDVSSLAETWTPLVHTLVRRAAADIGRNLVLDRGRPTQALFEAFVQAGARPRQAVMAVGDALMVNQRAQQLFTPGEQLAIHQHASFLVRDRDRVAGTVSLAAGRTVRIRATRVLAGGEAAGIVLLLDVDPRRPRPTDPAGPATGRRAGGAADRRPSSAWAAASEQIASALGSGQPVLVMGEAGTGKRSLVVELFGRAHPSGSVVAGEPEQALREAAAREAVPADAPTLVLLAHLDRVGGEQVGQLRASLASLDRSRYVLAATLADASTGAELPFQALLGCFDQAVTVPPLRFRVDDLPEIVARTLAELAPDRRVRLHPEAARLVGRQRWPGNLRQLREALREALLRRPVGEILPEDLPSWCRTAGSHTLTPVETTERDLIVTVLRRCGGNRLRAAASLGMARSSLYRKIRTYAITDE